MVRNKIYAKTKDHLALRHMVSIIRCREKHDREYIHAFGEFKKKRQSGGNKITS